MEDEIIDYMSELNKLIRKYTKSIDIADIEYVTEFSIKMFVREAEEKTQKYHRLFGIKK